MTYPSDAIDLGKKTQEPLACRGSVDSSASVPCDSVSLREFVARWFPPSCSVFPTCWSIAFWLFPPVSQPGVLDQDLVPFPFSFVVCQPTVPYGLDGFLKKEICWWDNPKKVGAITPHAPMVLALVSSFFNVSPSRVTETYLEKHSILPCERKTIFNHWACVWSMSPYCWSIGPLKRQYNRSIPHVYIYFLQPSRGDHGWKAHQGRFTRYGEAFGEGDTITAVVQQGAISFLRNGRQLGR